MKKEIKEFSNSFAAQLAELVRNTKAEAMGRYGLSDTEFNAVVTETFHILGREHDNWKKKAKLT